VVKRSPIAATAEQLLYVAFEICERTDIQSTWTDTIIAICTPTGGDVKIAIVCTGLQLERHNRLSLALCIVTLSSGRLSILTHCWSQCTRQVTVGLDYVT